MVMVDWPKFGSSLYGKMQDKYTSPLGCSGGMKNSIPISSAQLPGIQIPP